jgi:hypothetical protein
MALQICKGKPAEYLKNGGTTRIYRHLKTYSTLDIVTPNEERAAKTRNHLDEAFSRMSQNANPLKCRRHDDEPTDLDADKFKQLYVEWIADCGVALRINLAAHAFMFPQHAPDEAPAKNKAKKDTTSEYIKPSDADILKWRKTGPLGKLHNSVVFIRCSPQRIQRFKEISEKGHLRDNDTRLDSKYYMSERAIELADQIDY